MAIPGNKHCANCIGTLSFPISPDPVSYINSPQIRLFCAFINYIYLLIYLLLASSMEQVTNWNSWNRKGGSLQR